MEERIISASVSDKRYQVIRRKLITDPYLESFTCDTYNEAQNQYLLWRNEFPYYVALQEVIVIDNIVREEYHTHTLTTYRE